MSFFIASWFCSSYLFVTSFGWLFTTGVNTLKREGAPLQQERLFFAAGAVVRELFGEALIIADLDMFPEIQTVFS